MARGYTDRNYKFRVPRTFLEKFNIQIRSNDGRAAYVFLYVGVLFTIMPTYYKWREVGRREFMRREDRKVAHAIASVREEMGDGDSK